MKRAQRLKPWAPACAGAQTVPIGHRQATRIFRNRRYVVRMADHAHDHPPEGAAADWTVPQDWAAYSAEDHETWDILFARQSALLPGRACEAYLRGLDVLRLSKPGIPDYAELNQRLMGATGWQVVAVPGLVPDDVFFDHLANRRFVAGNFIRRRDQLDYLQEPDVFHDVFGHVPMLADPVFADYMAAYGQRRSAVARLRVARQAGAALLVHGRVRAGARGRRPAAVRLGNRLEPRREPLRARRSPAPTASPSISSA